MNARVHAHASSRRARTYRGIRRRSTAATVAALVLILAGCSGSEEVDATATDDPVAAATDTGEAEAGQTAPTADDTATSTAGDEEILDRLAAAQEATQAEGTARFALSQEISGVEGSGESDVPGDGVDGLTTSAEGALDFATDGLRMTISNQAAAALPGGGEVELLVDGETLYIRSPDTGDQWLSLPAADQDIDDELDPTGLLDDLTEAAVSAERVGTEEVRGVDTTRYDVTIDLEQQLEAATDDEQREQLQTRIDTLGDPLVPTSLWIDEDGRLRRQANEVTIAGPEGEEIAVSQTIEFYDFGAEVDLDPPEDVVSLPDLPLPTEG